MKEYITYFYNYGRAVCSRRTKADSLEAAEFSAEISLMCNYPNVEYQTVKTWEVREDETE